MPVSLTEAVPVKPDVGNDRRREPRENIPADLWMVDHAGETILKCRCNEVSEHGMRLSVPVGYGIAEGQRYELRSRMPGAGSADRGGFLDRSRWVRVVRTAVRLDGAFGTIDIGVTFDDAAEMLPIGSV